jgi:hypothetical protein
VPELERQWVRYVVGGLPELTVAMDFTDFDDDDHTTLCLYLVTRAGRALPLVWKTAKKSALKDNQTRLETEMLARLVNTSARSSLRYEGMVQTEEGSTTWPGTSGVRPLAPRAGRAMASGECDSTA